MHEIAALNLKIAICSSLSAQALRCFLDRLSFTGIPLCSVTSRDDAGAIKSGALAHSVRDCGLDAGQFIFLTDTAEGIRTANQAGVHPVLMMNDADEARRLSMHQPSGGIVSLHELPDLIRFVRANAG